MRVDKNGLLVKVSARVGRRILRAQDTADQTEAIHASSILLLRLVEVDERTVSNTRSYIYFTKQIIKLKLQPDDLITFYGYARANRNGYHFVYVRNIQVQQRKDDQKEQKILGVLSPHVALSDYVEYVAPRLKDKEVYS